MTQLRTVLINIALHSIIAILLLNGYVFLMGRIHHLHRDISMGIFTRTYFIFAFVITLLYYGLNAWFLLYRKRGIQLLVVLVMLGLGLINVVGDHPYRSLVMLISWLLPYLVLPIRLKRNQPGYAKHSI